MRKSGITAADFEIIGIGFFQIVVHIPEKFLCHIGIWGFFDTIKTIPVLKKLEQQEIIFADGVFGNAAKIQRLRIITGRTALALKVYKIEHGKYPDKLSELVPNYLPREYVSPSTGKKLDYSVKETNFTLSVDGSSITSER